LAQYRKSLEMFEKLGDIPNIANSLGQIGKVCFETTQYDTALHYYLQSFLIFTKIGSPNVEIVKGFIAEIREKMPEEQFNAIVEKLLGG